MRRPALSFPVSGAGPPPHRPILFGLRSEDHRHLDGVFVLRRKNDVTSVSDVGRAPQRLDPLLKALLLLNERR